MKTTKQILLRLAAGCTLAISFTSNLLGQITIATPRVFSDDHRTVQLRWNSETGAVYQVESADLLDGVGSQGLQWVIRDADCASKGTNSLWLDVGDTRWIPRILHPVFQSQRFYRIQKVKQATKTPPVVTIQFSQTNLVSSNFIVSVSASIVDTNQYLSSVGVFVDGQKIYSVLSTNFAVSINSTEWPNGQHEIYAIATTFEGGDIGETTPVDDNQIQTNDTSLAIGVSASMFPDFSNYISQFFVAIPFFQGGQTQEITAVFAEDSNWRVTVVNYLDSPVRWFEGQGTSCYAAWDGNDQSGSPLPYGYYDYIIEARPSQYGPLSLTGGGSSSSMMAASSGESSDTTTIAPTASYRRTPAAMQFSRTNTSIRETIAIPSLNASKPVTKTALLTKTESLFPSSPKEAMMAGLTSYFIKRPPLPPFRIKTNGVWIALPQKEIPPLEIQIPLSTQEKFLESLETTLGLSLEGDSIQNGPQAANWSDTTYYTRTPDRMPGNLFFGFAGTVGIGYQGHHPSKPPAYGGPSGGVLASTPPWGKLKTASQLANNFSISMGQAGWRTSFLLGDDNLNSTNLAPVIPGVSSGTFASKCNFGLLVGHMTASANTDPDFGSTTPYFPIYASYQPGALQWIALPEMDFGNGGSSSHLRWMALYGCQSLTERDYSDLWSKFLLPMPPNLRLILGSEDGIFIVPMFGDRLSENLNGWTTGTPMTIFNAWCDAATEADKIWDNSGWNKLPGINIGNRHMTAIYRDNSQGGSWRTINDSIWNWGSDISYDLFDISFVKVQVYTP